VPIVFPEHLPRPGESKLGWQQHAVRELILDGRGAGIDEVLQTEYRIGHMPAYGTVEECDEREKGLGAAIERISRARPVEQESHDPLHVDEAWPGSVSGWCDLTSVHHRLQLAISGW